MLPSTMAKFGAISVSEEDARLTAHQQQMRHIECVALVKGALMAPVQYWPKAPQVVGIPSNEPLAHLLGAEISVRESRVMHAERALLGNRWPAAPWLTTMSNIMDVQWNEINTRRGGRQVGPQVLLWATSISPSLSSAAGTGVNVTRSTSV